MRELRAPHPGWAVQAVCFILVAVTVVAGQEETAARAAAPATPAGPAIQWWMSTGEESALVQQAPVTFGADRRVDGAVTVDESSRGQSVLGVGAALTESAAVLLGSLPEQTRRTTLLALFDRENGAGIATLRVPLGASDFALGDYTYDDLPPGETDVELQRFSIERDREHMLPVLLEAIRINAQLRVVLTPWSAPAWMKTSGTTHGGELAPARESVYAAYLVKAVLAYRDAGVPVAALTLVNEPGHGTSDYPSMTMGVEQQERVALAVREQLDASGLATVSLLAHDHNWDDVAGPTALLTGPAAAAYGGVAFHCYAGDVSAQSAVADAAPAAEVWTTECSGGSWSDSWGGDLRWGARNMLIGAFRNWSVASLWWNLALDPADGPQNGGCTNCRGVVTVDPHTGSVSANVEQVLLTHVGRFVPPGSARIATPARTAAGVESVAFLTPAGDRVLIALNDGATAQTVTLRWVGRSARIRVPAGALVTATW